jgi:hypothetical protein
MLCAERLTWHDAPRDVPQPVLAIGIPPRLPTASGGLSGRPGCRIFPVDRLWVLQVESGSGWLQPVEPPPRLTFPTLAAAVSFAQQHGYDYRIIIPGPVASIGGIRARRDNPATIGQNNKEN